MRTKQLTTILLTLSLVTPGLAFAKGNTTTPEKILIVAAPCYGWAGHDQGITSVNEYLNNGYRLVSVVSLVNRTEPNGVPFAKSLCAYYLVTK